MPAMCSVAASAVPARPAESSSDNVRSPAKYDVTIIVGAVLLALTLTAGAIGSARALRAKPVAMSEVVASANADPGLNLAESQARATNGVGTPQSRALVERIVQPRELVETMPAPAGASKQEEAIGPETPADTEIAAGQPMQPAAKPCGAPQKAAAAHGTDLEFAATPTDAYKQAAKEHKLVFLLHISGNFEESGFT
jgi:hypothetical protein